MLGEVYRGFCSTLPSAHYALNPLLPPRFSALSFPLLLRSVVTQIKKLLVMGVLCLAGQII